MKPIVDSLKVLGESTQMFESLRDNLFAPKGLKFNSQICTSREQSERLLALGLKKETADMVWLRGHEKPVVLSNTFNDKEYGCIPAWSLHRLLCLYGLDYTIKEAYNNAEECYGMLICAIEIAIENGDFNEEYLER